MLILILSGRDRSEFAERLIGLLRESAPRDVHILEEGSPEEITFTDTSDTTLVLLVVTDSWPPGRPLGYTQRVLEQKERTSRIHVVFALDGHRFPWPFWEEVFMYLRYEWRHLWGEWRPPVTVTFLWSLDVRQAHADILRLGGLAELKGTARQSSDSLALSRADQLKSLNFELEANWLSYSTTQQAMKSGRNTVFTACHPNECVHEEWATLLAYSHTSDPLVLAQVREHASKELNGAGDMISIEKPLQIVRGAPISVVPQVPGVQFNPPRASYSWEEEWQVSRFRFRSEQKEVSPYTARGAIVFYVGPVLIAEVPVSMHIVSEARDPQNATPITKMAKPFAKVFVSYAHKDAAIVEALEQAYEALNIPYLRDARQLRSGDNWPKKIQGLIEEAEVFQLCWSQAASKSPEVRKEFDYAWNRVRCRPLMRPCRWQRRMPKPWDELKNMHFAALDLRPFQQFPKLRDSSEEK
jgi:hypothetical protein